MSQLWEVFTELHFEAAHFLPNLPEGHKCRRLHGHSFRVRVVLCAARLGSEGWVEDFAAIKARLEPIRLCLDHYLLNDVEGLENPTSENLAKWIWEKLQPELPQLSAVVVHETCTSGARYTGE